jgi:hypothetical protein
MKFFSNEAKENTDDRDRTDDDVAAVPQQRAGSPWGDAPRDNDDEVTDREQRDGTDEALGDRPGDRPADADRPWSQAGDVTDESDTARSTTTYGPDGTVTDTPEGDRDATLDADRDQDADRDHDLVADKDRVDKSDAVKDDGTFDSPKAVEPTTGEPLADKHDTSDELDTSASRDDNVDDTHVDAAAVPALDTEPPTTPDEDKAHAGDATPVVAAVAVPVAASSAASSAGSSSDRLFPDGDSFNERFRDIQLRFVDSPKEATAEAAALVSEAVDKLTSNLKSQRDSLTGGSDDTEKLRVELRAYRDLLNRLVNL